MRTYHRLFFLYFLSLPYTGLLAQTQKQDSLFVLLKKTGEDTSRVALFNQIAYSYYSNNLAKTEKYAKAAISLAEKLHDQSGIAGGYHNLGIAASLRGDYDNALLYLLKALKLQDARQDQVAVAKTLHSICSVYIGQADYIKALEYARRSLALHQQTGQLTRVADNFFVIGIIHLKQGDDTQAKEYFLKALQRYQQVNEKQRIGNVYSFIGTICMNQAKFKKAEWYYREALTLAQKIQDRNGVAAGYSDLGHLYIQLKQYDEARSNLLKALTRADKHGLTEEKLTIYQRLSEAASSEGNHARALAYYKNYANLKDSLYSSQKSHQLAELQVEYETLQKEKENQLLKENLQSEKRTLVFTSIVLILFIGLSITGYFYYRSKKRANHELQKLNEEIRQQKEEIEAQAEVLQAANLQVVATNESLEMAVRERTKRLEETTQQLLTYAFLNSHKVRGPLARVMGLTNLLKQSIQKEEITFIVQALNESAEELDQVIKELNEVLQTEEVNIARERIRR